MPQLDLDGRSLHVEDSGGDGPPVVFCHGFLLDHTMFAAQVAQLSDVYRVITWDQRGFGDSPADGPFTLWDLADDLFGIMDHLGIERAVLAGAGQGGYVALRAALLAPDRVRALALLGSQAADEPTDLASEYRAALDRWIGEGYHDAAGATLATRLVGPDDPTAHWQDRWRQLDTDQLRLAASALLERDDLSDRVEELAMPVLLTHGTADRAVPMDRAHAICAEVSDCRGVIEVSGAGHAPSLTHPEVVTPALRDFLEGLPA